MFTGLVSDVGTVERRAEMGEGVRFRIRSAYDAASIAIGASIACSGPCLTAVAVGAANAGSWFDVDVSPETLACTTAGDWAPGTHLNLERSLALGGELGGHLVTGHVDGVETVLERAPEGEYTRFTISLSPALAPLVAAKGSVSLSGTSLTVNAAEADRFSVMLIPHTLQVTTWGETGVGDRVNIEVDLMARYAARLAAFQP
ncbi:MAG: riboflavin synthase [Rhodobiaceae bacterium]|nr:riboflavin synthase [Rhodobiaceae bacterium]